MKLTKVIRFFSCLALLWVLVVPVALAAPATSSARGQIVDHEGNPVAGVDVVFTNLSKTDTEYRAKTNKKGRYFLSNLYYYPTNKKWQVRVEAEGYVPTHVTVNSRSQQAVIDKFEAEVRKGQDIPPVTIAGFGEAEVDVVVTPAAELADVADATGEAVVVEQVAPAAGSQDPWDAAVRKAAAGDLAGSVELFEKAIENAPDDAERRSAFAKVLYQLERHADAAREATKAAELAPDSLDARMVLYSVRVATNDLAGAGAALDEARKVAPRDPRVLSQVAYLADRRKDPAAAIEAYRTLTEIDPTDTSAWVALGDLHAQAGDSVKSEAAYQKVVELDPENAYQVFFNIGALIMNRPGASPADTQRAVKAFRRATEIKPDYAQAHRELAFALLGTGDFPGATAALESYLSLQPEAPDANDMRALLEGLKQ